MNKKMISNKLDDYKVYSILGSEEEFTYYKVQDKVTGIFYLWQAIHYNLEEDSSNALITEILIRKGVDNKNFLKVYDYIYHSGTKTVYIITEYCSHGSLLKVIQNCLKNGQYINESLIWNILYAVSNLLKENMCQFEDICLNNIFLDDKNRIKLLNLKFPGENIFTNCSKEEICPIEQLGVIIYKLCALDCSEKCKIDFVSMPNHYSEELYNIIEFLLHKTDIQPTIDAILYHPTILVNLSNYDQQKIVYLPKMEENNQTNIEISMDSRLQQLKLRENNLKIKERELKERENHLRKRERKIILVERLVKEKLRRAEMYLKSSKEKRFIITPNENDDLSECHINEDSSRNIYENIKSIKKVPRTKLCTNSSKRRVNFTENKIRFKGHSPLKEIQNCPKHSREINERNNKKKIAIKTADWNSETNSDKTVIRSATIDTKNDPRKCTNKNKNERFNAEIPVAKSKSSPKNAVSSDKIAAARRHSNVRRSFLNMVFNKTVGAKKRSNEDDWGEQERCRLASVQMYEEIGDFVEEDKFHKTEIAGCKALVWTEENKKQAFDMLRVINEDEEINGIKHTYL